MDTNLKCDEIAVKQLDKKPVLPCAYTNDNNEDETDVKPVSIAHDSSLPSRCDAEYWVEIQNHHTLQVDNVPSPKESRKSLSPIIARLCSFVHNYNWKGLAKYGMYLRAKYPGTKGEAYAILTDIHIVDRYCSEHRFGKAQQLCDALDVKLQNHQGPYADSLSIRFLTTKGSLLYRKGEKEQCAVVLRKAITECDLLTIGCSHGYAFYIFAILVLGDTVDDDVKPLRRAQAEHMLRLCCEFSQRWVGDLEEDHKLTESLIKYFWLWPRLLYIFALLGSNACATTWITCFGTSCVEREKLDEAKLCLDKVRSEWQWLTPRARLAYHLAMCDCHLRYAQFKPEPACYEYANFHIEQCTMIYTDCPKIFIRGERDSIRVRHEFTERIVFDSVRGSDPEVQCAMNNSQTAPKLRIT
jgi:hypothetical protein